MRHEASFPSQDDDTLKTAVRAFRFTHDEPLEKIQLVRMGLYAENYVDEVLRDDVPIPDC